MLKRLKARNERGYVMAFLAISMFALLLICGFGIDIGTWYLRASQIQRASDAAALAAASKMPNGDSATTAALAAAQHNGMVDGVNGIHIVTSAELPSRFRVQITDSNVPRYFSSLIFDHMSLTRSSHSEYLDAVPLGSPFNLLGTGDLTTGSSVAKANYWLAVNGYCTAKEDGDLFLSKYDGNKGGTTTICPATETNPDYDADGYDYVVEVPANSPGAVDVKIYDAAFAPGKSGSLGTSPDGSSERSGDSSATIDTTYTLWNTQNTADTADDTLVKSETFTTNDSRPGAIGGWWTLTSVTSPVTNVRWKFRLQVTTKANQTHSYGVNAFGLSADRTWDTGKACDSRSDDTCPEVYGSKAMSVYANLNPSGSTGAHQVDFYLSQIASGYAGKPLQVTLWDPGEGGKSISLIAPDGTVMPFDWTAVPAETGMSGSTSALDVSGTGPQPGPNRASQYKFNDRLVELSLQIPTDYASHLGANGDEWWRIRYTMPASGAPSDRTTWSVSVAGSDPVHLIRN